MKLITVFYLMPVARMHAATDLFSRMASLCDGQVSALIILRYFRLVTDARWACLR
jgi:hypothetical protein